MSTNLERTFDGPDAPLVRHKEDEPLDNLSGLDDAWHRYLAGHTRGRLATVGSDGAPQNKPVGFVYNAEFATIDIVGFDMDKSAKYRNVGVNPDVAFVVDDAVSQGAAGMRFVEIRGVAERVSVEQPASAGVSSQIIRIHPRRVITMNVDPDRPGFQTRDLVPTLDETGLLRPSLDNDAAAPRANDAVVGLVAALQAGWDENDADVTDGPLADDVLWGSPFGATLQGYELLHAAHIRLKEHGAGGTSSRFEIVRVIAPAPNVVVAQVRRVALNTDGNPVEPTADLTGTFSEMALYVLVRRDRTWWLAAGQNTPLRPPPS